MEELTNILDIKNLTLNYQSSEKVDVILDNVIFSIPKGKITGITGESGSGKSLSALSILGLTSFFPALKLSGSVIFENKNLLNNTDLEWTKIRGRRISLIMQQPESALNPLISCGKQILEAIIVHQKSSSKVNLKNKVEVLLNRVGLSDTNTIYQSYPHELSGGQLQRILIAMAIANDPEVIIADEITASLDAATAKDIISLLVGLKSEMNTTLIFITHDIHLLKLISDQIVMMHNGKIVDVFQNIYPLNEGLQQYTRDYLNYTYTNEKFRQLKSDYHSQEILNLSGISKIYYKNNFWGFRNNRSKVVLQDIELTIKRNEMYGILGESGSGKTTLGKIIAGLINPSTGNMSFNGEIYNGLILRNRPDLRKQIQIIFQDASTSMNPKITIGRQLEEVIDLYKIALGKENIKSKLETLFNELSVPISCLKRYPHEVSGGQRQRIVLARTLLLSPDLLIFDETLSALDVMHQHMIMDLILTLQKKYGFAGIFISHDPKLVKYLCTHVMILNDGEIIDAGEIVKVFTNPMHPKTKNLLEGDY